MATCKPNNRAPRLAIATATRTGVRVLLASGAGEAYDACTRLVASDATLRLAAGVGRLSELDPMVTDELDSLPRFCCEAGTAVLRLGVVLAFAVERSNTRPSFCVGLGQCTTELPFRA